MTPAPGSPNTKAQESLPGTRGVTIAIPARKFDMDPTLRLSTTCAGLKDARREFDIPVERSFFNKSEAPKTSDNQVPVKSVFGLQLVIPKLPKECEGTYVVMIPASITIKAEDDDDGPANKRAKKDRSRGGRVK